MNQIFLFSVVLKGIGAVLEITLQIQITRQIGVSGYGTYAAWINAADLVFWMFFSGLIKLNTFYLSGNNTAIGTFRKKYFFRYVVPILGIGTLAAVFYTRSIVPCAVLSITGLELLVMDQSSTFIARGRSVISLVGEYVLGRLILVVGILVLGQAGELNVCSLVIMYIFQYVIIFLLFQVTGRKKNQFYKDISDKVSLHKWGAYQKSDLLHSLIEQMPVLLQYFFAGAFEAGVVSIVLLVKKLINFISGPTAKVFLPEFSRLYRKENLEEIRCCYASIMRIQMLIIGPLAVVLMGYPTIVLKILAKELTEYTGLFAVCSGIFLLAATLGPCGGILQMTGNEKADNRLREMAIGCMAIVLLVLHKNSWFVLYGLCVQAALEAMGKFIFLCKWMKKAPVDLKTYLQWWIVPCVVIVITCVLQIQESFLGMMTAAGVTFIYFLVKEIYWNGKMLKGWRIKRNG